MPKQEFSHRQLYVPILSRVTLPKKLRVLIIKKDEKYINYTKNIVYNKVFNECAQCNYLSIYCAEQLKKINSIYSFNI